MLNNKKKIGYRYEIINGNIKGGLFRHSKVLSSINIRYDDISYQTYNKKEFMFNWLPHTHNEGKYYFTYEGFKRIQPYIRFLRNFYKQYDLEIKLKYTVKKDYLYKDRWQFCTYWR